MEISFLLLLLAGAAGALAKDILEDNKIVLPKCTDGILSLGFLGGITTGAAAGYFIDGSLTTAFMGGYAGTGILTSLIGKGNEAILSTQQKVKILIKAVAKEQGVDPDLAVRVATCESNLSPTAKNTNKDGSIDRGLFQWNNKYHPEISDEAAYDIILSTRAFCKAFKEGNLSWWNATRSCWEKPAEA